MRSQPPRIWSRGRDVTVDWLAGAGIFEVLPPLAEWWHGNRGYAVLTYHRIGGEDDPFFPGIPTARFAAQMDYLAEHWNVLPIGELVARAQAHCLPARALGITFDDNYQCVHDIAWPILRQLGLSATVFVPTGPLLDGVPLWYDRCLHAFKSARRTHLPALDLDDLPYEALDIRSRGPQICGQLIAAMQKLQENDRRRVRDQVESALQPGAWCEEPALAMGSVTTLRDAVEEGLTIGSHSVSHPIFSRLSADRALTEVVDSKRTLEDWLQRPIDCFAYPNGKFVDYNATTMQQLQSAGYHYAFTTERGLNRADGCFRYELRRNDFCHADAVCLRTRLALLGWAA